MIKFNYLGYEVTIHDYIFCPGYPPTLEEPGEDEQYFIESVTVQKDGQPFDDFEFFEIIEISDFQTIAEQKIKDYEIRQKM